MERVAAVEEVPDEGSFLFTVRERESGDTEEAILVRTDGGIRAWRNYCQHFTHIRLDKGDGVRTRNGELVCTNHGAMFDPDSGRCTFGPCEGAYLGSLDIAVEDGTVYLTDGEYEFVAAGPAERDPTDLSSTSNIEF
ncbi:MAG: Rieske (2Fe-2S) protein [Halobacteriaceae archaeon]